MASSHSTSPDTGATGPGWSVTFDVMMDEDPATRSSPRQARVPVRFQKTQQTDTDETERARKINEKQLKAQQKKKELEAARLLRIQQRREQCCLMASKMERLLAQDAKRQGVAGTENIRPMSRKEAGSIIQSVHQDFQQLGAELKDNLGT